MYIIMVSVDVKHHERSFETSQRLPETRKFTDLFQFFTPSPVSSSLICAILQSDRTVTKCVHLRIFLLNSPSVTNVKKGKGVGAGGEGGNTALLFSNDFIAQNIAQSSDSQLKLSQSVLQYFLPSPMKLSTARNRFVQLKRLQRASQNTAGEKYPRSNLPCMISLRITLSADLVRNRDSLC